METALDEAKVDGNFIPVPLYSCSSYVGSLIY